MNLRCTASALCVALAGCLPANTPDTSGPPRITSFTATPSTIEAGKSSTLAWTVDGNYDSLILDHQIGDVTGKLSYRLPALYATDTFTLTATSLAGTNSAQVSITVTAAAAASALAVSIPATATKGSPVALTVKATDGGGNTVAGFTGTVHFTSTDGAATLPSDYVFIANDAGQHTFNATFNTAGSQTVTAISGALTGTSSACAVSAGGPAPATSCALTNVASSVASGASFTAHVKLLDAGGHVATGYTGTLGWTSTDGSATLPSASAFGSGDAGERDVAITLRTAGSQSITATDQANAAITCSASSTVVTSGPVLAKFAFSGLAATATAGTPVSFTVTAQDSTSTTLTSYRGQVSFTSTDGAALLPAAYSFTAGDNGAHTFSATFGTAGSQTLTVDDSSASVSKTSSAVTVSAAASGTALVYTNPAAGSKVRLVKNAASTSTVAVLDLVANASMNGYSVALNLPVSPTRVTLDSSGIAKGAALDPGSAPAAIAAVLPSSGPLSGVLVSALSQKAGGTGAQASDASISAGQVLYTLKLDLKSGAPAGVVFDGATPGSLFRASLRNKLGNEQAGSADFAIGKLEVQ